MPANVTALSTEYSGASTRLAAATTDGIVAVGRISGGSVWTSAAGWLFRGSAARRFDVIIEGAEVLQEAAKTLTELEAAVSQAELEMETAKQMLAQPLSVNPFALPSGFVVIPGQAELAGATSRRDEAYRRAAETLTALAMAAPISERYHADYVEKELRKDGIDIEVEVQDGVIVDADWDGLNGKKMWKVMGLTEAGRRAQADLKESAGYDDGFFSLKTWSPYHGGGRIAIAYMEGDELRMFLEGVGAIPIPGAGGVAKVGAKVVGKVAAKVSGKVAAKVATKVSAKVAKKVSKEVSEDVTAKVAAKAGTDAGGGFVQRVERHTAEEYVVKRAAAQAAAGETAARQAVLARQAAQASAASRKTRPTGATRRGRANTTISDETLAKHGLIRGEGGVLVREGAGSRLSPGGGLKPHERGGARGVAGHTIHHFHVGATRQQLAQRIADFGVKKASTFYTRAVAENAVSMTLEANEAAIKAWLRAGAPIKGSAFTLDMTRPVGFSLAKGSMQTVQASRVKVVLRPVEVSARNPDGYYILTSFPEALK